MLIGEKEEYTFVLDDDTTTNLDRIHDGHESDEARLRAVVEKFLREPRSSPSWKNVIWALYCEDEIDKAQQIMSYAEPLGGMLQTLYARAEAIQLGHSGGGYGQLCTFVPCTDFCD